jgi:DNA invertase Pin-like site-specific DNA recombinase
MPNMDKLKRAWIYTRIDAPEDKHGALKGQERELLDYAAQMGLNPVGCSSDIGADTGTDRPGLTQVRDAAQRGSFDVLTVSKLSRIGRETAVTAVFLSELARLGIEICSLLEGNMDMEQLSKVFSGAEQATNFIFIPKAVAAETQEPDQPDVEDMAYA